MKNLRILGIDPGTARCGFGVIEVSSKDGSIEWISHGCIQTDKLKTDSERLNCVFNDIMNLIVKFKPDQIAIELLFIFRNLKTAMKISEARGVILLACAKKGLALQTFEYTPLQVKLAVTGYGRSEKKEVLRQMFLEGIDVCRLNFSHGEYKIHIETINTIRELNKELGLNVAILVDLQGPKLRIGEIENNNKKFEDEYRKLHVV